MNFWAGFIFEAFATLTFCIVFGTSLKALWCLLSDRAAETGVLHWRSSWAAIPIWLISTWSLATPNFLFATTVGSVVFHALLYSINHAAARGNYRSG